MKNYFAEVMSKYKLKQKDVAALLNTKQATISGYNTGKRHPDFSVFVKLADYLNISLDSLFERNAEYVSIQKEEYDELIRIRDSLNKIIK